MGAYAAAQHRTSCALSVAAATAVHFVPRDAFPVLTSLPRSYFLGHHKAGLEKMKTLVNQIDLVIECRDYRIPLTSRNPLLEEVLSDKHRIIVYTKRDLGFDPMEHVKGLLRESIIRRWHAPALVHFSESSTTTANNRSASKLVSYLKKYAGHNFSLTGHRVLVAGMPNVGKSTLLNALRSAGVKKGKAAKTGAQPGVTRKIGSAVKIVDRTTVNSGDAAEIIREGVYVLDTPGVFMPYVPHAESMLKLALCGAVKDSIIAPVTLADYLLFRLNLHDPTLYAAYMPDAQPTNDVVALLESVAVKTGRLTKGSASDIEGAAMWLIQRWRAGLLGKFVLDDVDQSSLERLKSDDVIPSVSVSQAKKMEKESIRRKMRERRASTSA